MRDSLKRLLNKKWFAYTFAACSAVVLFILLSNLEYLDELVDFVSPVLWGAGIAYLMNPIIGFVERKLLSRLKSEKRRYIYSVIIAIITVLLALSLLVSLLIPPMSKSISGIVSNIEVYGSNLREYIGKINIFAEKIHINIGGLTASVENIINNSVEYIAGNADTILGAFWNVGMSIVNIAIGIVIAVYFMFDKKKIVETINRFRRLLMRDTTYYSHNNYFYRCHRILSRFLLFDVVDGAIIAIANMLFMFILGMPNIALVSVIVGVTNLIPTFGPVIGALIGGIIVVLTNPMHALLFLIFTVIIQTFDASVIKPKLFGDSFGVPPVWIFVAIVFGGKLMGVLGIVLAVPFSAIVTFTLNEIIIPRLEERKKRLERSGD